MVSTLCKCIQRARYEGLLLKLATAYDGYRFYLPAFLDFRGRIYRSGILHFHERDLARSLIIFARNCDVQLDQMGWNLSVDDFLYVGGSQLYSENSKDYSDMFHKIPVIKDIVEKALTAAVFHYKSFVSEKQAMEWFMENNELLTANLDIFNANNTNQDQYRKDLLCRLLVFAKDAKHPCQFVSNLVGLPNYCMQPITHDASASAYQLMSYFLLNENLAWRTNLIPNPHGEIQDIYSNILYELLEFIHSEMSDRNLSRVVCSRLTRKIVNMPIIYGKTLMSTDSYGWIELRQLVGSVDMPSIHFD